MICNVKLTDHRRTLIDEMILELKCNGAAHMLLVEEDLDEGDQVRARIAEVTLKVKTLDKITDTKELVTALRQQCEVQVAIVAVYSRRGPVCCSGPGGLVSVTCGGH